MQHRNLTLLACCPEPPRPAEAGIPGKPGGMQARKKEKKKKKKQPSNHLYSTITITMIPTQPQPSQPSTAILHDADCPLLSQQILLHGKGRAVGPGHASLICTTHFISKFDLKGRSDKPLVMVSTLAVFLVTPMGGNPQCNAQR